MRSFYLLEMRDELHQQKVETSSMSIYKKSTELFLVARVLKSTMVEQKSATLYTSFYKSIATYNK